MKSVIEGGVASRVSLEGLGTGLVIIFMWMMPI